MSGFSVGKSKVAFVALLALLIVSIPAVASAKFTNKVAQTRAQQVATDTLSPPTGVTVKCFGSAGRITVSWTPTADTYATGYIVTGYFGGSAQNVTVTPRTATTVSPTPNVPMGTSVTMTAEYLKTSGSKTTDWISASTSPVTVNTNCP